MKRISVAFLCVLLLFTAACGSTDGLKQRTVDGSYVFSLDNYPRIAVTEYTKTAAVNITAAVLGVDADKAGELLTVCDTTDECYILLKNNLCDLVIAHEYGSVAEAELKNSALKTENQMLWCDALVFFANGSQKVDSLTSDQLKKLYNSEIKDWSELGGLEPKQKMPVVLFGAPDGTASKAAFEKYFGKDIEVQPVMRTVVTEKGKYEAAVSYDNRDGAIGYSLLSEISGSAASGLKLFNIDGVEPTEDNIQSGKYKLKTEVLLTVRVSEPAASPVRLLYNWILSEQGKLCY